MSVHSVFLLPLLSIPFFRNLSSRAGRTAEGRSSRGDGSTYVSLVRAGDETGAGGSFLGHLAGCWLEGGWSG